MAGEIQTNSNVSVHYSFLGDHSLKKNSKKQLKKAKKQQFFDTKSEKFILFFKSLK